VKLLFVCTHNRCRSILSEAICNHVAGANIEAYSAGSSPSGVVHPLALENLKQRGISVDGLKSQSWEEYSAVDIDAVITLCDSAAGEACPLWMGSTLKAHWGMPDPSAISGTDEQITAAFAGVISTLEQRVTSLVSMVSDASEPDLKRILQQVVDQHPAPKF
jgi:arsenate reductase